MSEEARSVFSPSVLPVTVALASLIALFSFDSLAVFGALPDITADLGDVGLTPWVITAFFLTATVSVVVAGPLIDGFGVQRTFRWSLTIFLAASTLCAVAPSILVLVIGRGLQGAAGGVLTTLAIAAVGLTYPSRLRPKAFAANSTVWGAVALIGPALVALLVATVGWRGVFFANLPLGLMAGVIGWRRFPGRQRSGGVHLDVRGVLLLSAFTVVLVIGLSTLDWRLGVAGAVAALLAVLFWRHSGRAAEPVIARKHLVGVPISYISLGGAAGFAAAIGLQSYLPIYVQGGLGRSATAAAFSVLFLSLGWTLASIAASWLLDRFSEVSVIAAGYLALAPPIVVALVVYDANTPLALVLALSTIAGVGVGSTSNGLLVLLQRTSLPDELGRASGIFQFSRNLGSTVAAAAAGATLVLVVQTDIGDVEAVQGLLAGDDDVAVTDKLRAAVASGYRWAHLVAVPFVAAGGWAVVRLLRRERRPVDQVEATTQ